MNVSHHHQSRSPPRSASKSPLRTATKKPPFRHQHDIFEANEPYDNQGNLRDSVTFAQLAATAPDPDGQLSFFGGIQTQPSHASTVEPTYHRDRYAQYQNAYNSGSRYQNVEDSDNEDDEEEECVHNFDFNEHTRRANDNSYSVPIFDGGANKKGKVKKDEDGVSVLFEDMSVVDDDL